VEIQLRYHADARPVSTAGKLHSGDEGTESGAAAEGEEILLHARRENQDEAAPFHQRRETRDAERHEEETKELPAVEAGVFAGGADDERDADDGGDAERGEPEIAARVEVSRREKEIPDEVTPERDFARLEFGEVSHDALFAPVRQFRSG